MRIGITANPSPSQRYLPMISASSTTPKPWPTLRMYVYLVQLKWLIINELVEQFIENFKPPSSLLSLDDPPTLHPSNTPWIYYGGSYAGARAAHMRTHYPHLVFGAIASSGKHPSCPSSSLTHPDHQLSRMPRSSSTSITMSSSNTRPKNV